MLTFPIPSVSHLVPFRKNVPNPLRPVKPLRMALVVSTNLNIFNHPNPSRIDKHNEVVPHQVFNLGFLPYFLVGHPIVTLNPNRPKRNVAEKVQILIFLTKSLGILSP
jgi:hypothetical protein